MIICIIIIVTEKPVHHIVLFIFKMCYLLNTVQQIYVIDFLANFVTVIS